LGGAKAGFNVGQDQQDVVEESSGSSLPSHLPLQKHLQRADAQSVAAVVALAAGRDDVCGVGLEVVYALVEAFGDGFIPVNDTTYSQSCVTVGASIRAYLCIYFKLRFTGLWAQCAINTIR
jgi:hypothetical protein